MRGISLLALDLLHSQGRPCSMELLLEKRLCCGMCFINTKFYLGIHETLNVFV